MSWLGASALALGGVGLLLLTWNSARPVIDPTRRYSPLWLPAMVVAEVAQLFVALHVVVAVVGFGLGGWGHTLGRIGAIALGCSTAALGWVVIRSYRGVRRLRPRAASPVQPARGPARWRGRPVPTPPGVDERLGIEWAPGLTLDLSLPSTHRAGDARPVVVYVHGGGWTGGDPQHQARDLYHALALDGWVVAAIRYPLAPAVTVERQVGAVRAAVRWVRGHLPEHGVEPTGVVLAGGSAGGHLAATAAMVAEHPAERVDACVPIYGVFDLANRNRTRARWTTIERNVVQAPLAAAPERYAAMSPLDRIHDATPPMLVVHGTHDTLVPIGEAEQFVAALQAAGRPVELLPVYGAQHAFDAMSGATSRTVAAVVTSWLRARVPATAG